MSDRQEPRLPGTDAKPLDGKQKEEWEKLLTAGGEAGAAMRAGDTEGVEEALERFRDAQIDPQAVLNAIHVPEDAGEWAEGIRQIFRRIPDGWGRWLSCGAGWYPIVVQLDQQLAELDPAYEVHQVKEKWGRLEYYFAGSSAVFGQMDQLVEAAREEAARTCETCGQPGRLCTSSGTVQGWYQTLCHTCAGERGYQPLPRREAEWS